MLTNAVFKRLSAILPEVEVTASAAPPRMCGSKAPKVFPELLFKNRPLAVLIPLAREDATLRR